MDLRIDPDVARAATLPAAFYRDSTIYGRLVEEVLPASWQFLGDTDLVKHPGSVAPLTMLEGSLDEPIALTRDTDDRVHVLSNVCTHRGMAVVEGAGSERYLRCRYHGRRFGLDGGFQHMPEFEGACGFPSPSDDLPRPPAAAWGKLLFAAIRPAVPFDVALAPVRERLAWWPAERVVFAPERAREYVVRAHWALYVDNYLEGFHIPFIHAGLGETLVYEEYATEQYPWANLQLAVAKPGETAFDLPPSSPDYGKRIGAYYYWLFPNTMLNFYPWGLSVNVVKPLGPALTKVVFLPYVLDPSKLGEGAGGDLDRVEREDEVVVELVQRGVRSRLYQAGRFSPTREANVHHFHRLLARALGSDAPGPS